MVDSQFAPLTEKIVAAIKQISDGPIRFLVNTHVHGDHTGGNENFGKLGVDDPGARPSCAPAREADPRANGAAGSGAAGRAAGRHLRRADDDPHERRRDRADPGPGRAHRRRHDGVISQRRRHHDRRLLPLDRLPEHRPRQRRDAQGHARRLDTIIELAGPNTKIVPGHGAIVDKAAVAAHRDMIVACATSGGAGQAGQDAGRRRRGQADGRLRREGHRCTPTTADRFVGQLYQELKTPR